MASIRRDEPLVHSLVDERQQCVVVPFDVQKTHLLMSQNTTHTHTHTEIHITVVEGYIASILKLLHRHYWYTSVVVEDTVRKIMRVKRTSVQKHIHKRSVQIDRYRLVMDSQLSPSYHLEQFFQGSVPSCSPKQLNKLIVTFKVIMFQTYCMTIIANDAKVISVDKKGTDIFCGLIEGQQVDSLLFQLGQRTSQTAQFSSFVLLLGKFNTTGKCITRTAQPNKRTCMCQLNFEGCRSQANDELMDLKKGP